MSDQLLALWGLLRPYRSRYAVGGALLLLCDLGQLVAPWLIGVMVDGLRAGRLSTAALGRDVALLLASSLAVALGRYGWRHYVFCTARMVERDLRLRLYGHLQTLSASFFGSHKIGDLMAHSTNDVQAACAVAGEGVVRGLDPIFYIVGTLAAMVLTVNWRLTLASLLPLPLIALANGALGRQVHRRYKLVQATFSDLSDQVQEAVSGIRVVKGFVQEEPMKQRFAAVADSYRQRFMAMERFHSGFDPVVSLLAGTSSAIALFVGGQMVQEHALSLGKLVSFFGYLNMLTWPMLAISAVFNLLQRASASMSRLQQILDFPAEIADAQDPLPLPAPVGGIRVRDLTFSYAPDRPAVLSGLDFELAPGQVLGVVGRTGSGKSTLVSLLARVYDPPAGTVFVDGIDVRDLELTGLRDAIGYVPQDSFLFSRSLEANVDFGPPPRGTQAVLEALQQAAIADEAAALPEGLATVMGERGVTLSGGQRQRVSLARALVRRPPILILDDCLSAVDAATENQILTALRALRDRDDRLLAAAAAPCTTILVCHRLSIVREADLILVLDRGRIAERGTHQELLAAAGDYARTWRQQQAEAAVAAEA